MTLVGGFLSLGMPEAYRGSARQRGYGTAWDKASIAYRKANPLCLGCQAMGRLEPATVVDHVQPHKGNAALFWDEANWQPACTWHHSNVKQQLEALHEQGAIPLADLRLDSRRALELARRTPRRVAAVGADGWQIG